MSATLSPNAMAAGAMNRTLERLKALIASGELSPGEQIRQEEMAEQLEVSRVPLREALNVLANQGLLHHRHNQGYFVVKRTRAESQQISRMLHLLENELMTSIAWPSEAQLGMLRTLNTRMRACVEASDLWGLMQLNRQFHFEMFSLSPHRLILEQVQRLWTLTEPVLWAKFQRKDERDATLQEHDRLIDALERRDMAAYIAEMHQHRHPIAVADAS